VGWYRLRYVAVIFCSALFDRTPFPEVLHRSYNTTLLK